MNILKRIKNYFKSFSQIKPYEEGMTIFVDAMVKGLKKLPGYPNHKISLEQVERMLLRAKDIYKAEYGE